MLKINNINLQLQKHCIYTIRNINNYSIEEFKTRLIYESWDSIFGCNGNVDTDTLFNLFHNNYLRIFYTSFPSRKITERSNNNSWLTPGIRISCKRKRCLYLLTKESDDVILKNYYKQYCETLTSVIKVAKKYMYNNKMAAILSRVDESVSQNCKESDVKQQSSCNYCVKYKCELEELILELSYNPVASRRSKYPQ